MTQSFPNVRVRIDRNPNSDSSNPPKILYPLLRSSFQQGLTAHQLFVGCQLAGEEGPPLEAPGIRASFSSYREEFEDANRWTERTKEKLITDWNTELQPWADHQGVSVDLEFRDEILEPRRLWSPSEFPSTWGDRDLSYYRFHLVRAPGTLWALVTLIAAFDGNIDYVYHDASTPPKGWNHESPAGLGSGWEAIRVSIAFSLPATAPDENGGGKSGSKSSLDSSDRMAAFEFQAKSLHGCLGVVRCQVKQPLAEIEKGIRGTSS